ncbi:MAG: PQQ-like beta-propeller repeat protein, partial [Cyclobacteriaceae bacterium]|nr:PQQ-like beta-propeller repeat protein [Cyclobacteriaceae bacterium]
MNSPKTIFITVASSVFVVVLIWWSFSNPRVDVVMSEPGADKQGDRTASVGDMINIGEFFDRFLSVEPTLEETWPTFRGSNFDNIYKSDIKMIDKFGPEGPEILWSVDLGEGHAGPAVYKGLVYVLDYDEELKADMLRCFTLKDGKELWRRWYNVQIKRNHGISRTIPAVTEKYIVTVGPRSHVMCVDRLTGDLLWSIDVEKEYNTEIPFWYTGQCPLIDNGVAIIAAGGTSLLIGVDCATGEILWETPNNDGLKMSHASITPWE